MDQESPSKPTSAQPSATAPKKAARAREEDSELPPDSDLEDRFNHFWKTHGNSIFATAALAMVVVLGVQIYDYLQGRALASKQAAFAQAVETGQLAEFAESYTGEALAGVALLKVAHGLYAEEKFAQALESYQTAAESLGNTPFYERAILGAAMSRLLAGDKAAGSMELGAIAANPVFKDPTRAEAAYNLALHHWQNEDFTAMNAAIDQILTLSSPGMSGMRAERLRERVPALRE